MPDYTSPRGLFTVESALDRRVFVVNAAVTGHERGAFSSFTAARMLADDLDTAVTLHRPPTSPGGSDA